MVEQPRNHEPSPERQGANPKEELIASGIAALLFADQDANSRPSNRMEDYVFSLVVNFLFDEDGKYMPGVELISLGLAYPDASLPQFTGQRLQFMRTYKYEKGMLGGHIVLTEEQKQVIERLAVAKERPKTDNPGP